MRGCERNDASDGENCSDCGEQVIEDAGYHYCETFVYEIESSA